MVHPKWSDLGADVAQERVESFASRGMAIKTITASFNKQYKSVGFMSKDVCVQCALSEQSTGLTARLNTIQRSS